MSLSERLQSVHFNKGAIGYNTKEVDAFFSEMRTAAERDEAALRTLRAKLDAFEGKSAEIARTENEAYRLLAAAKDEAEKLRAAAEAQAKTLLEDAKARAAAAEAVAAERAAVAEREAARRANETVGNAKQNAAMILAAADKRGRETLAAAEREAAATRAKAAALSRRSAEFEEKLRSLTADTVRALAALNAAAPAPSAPADSPALAASAVPSADAPDAARLFASRPRRTDRVRPTEPVPAPETAAETAAASAAAVPAAPAADTEADNTAHDYAFAGGKLLAKDGERQNAAPRKLYDAVSVTYDDGGDGYDDIKRLMDSAADRKLKNPTDFAN